MKDKRSDGTDDATPPQDATPDVQAPDDRPVDTETKPDAAPAEDKAPVDYHEQGQPHISVDLFISANSIPEDQLAGFRHYARTNHPSKYTIADWEKHLLAFNQRVVK